MLVTERLIALVLIGAFLFLGGRIAQRTSTRADTVAWRAVLIGLVTARVGFVLANLDAYRTEPLSAMAVWQGGFALWPGVLAALVTIFVMLRRRRSAFLLGGAALGLALAASFLTPMTRPAPHPLPPDLVLSTLDGDTVALDDLRGRPFVLNIWATWCGPCRREMPMVVDVARDATIPVYLANAGEDLPRIREYLENEGLSGKRVLVDPQGQAIPALDTRALPTTLFIDGSGMIVSTHVGEISRAELAAQIKALERTLQ
ncbi:hypothetical protein LK12_05565 [Novosphingobium malaysiense]|uniref:Thioredoxin domain-containing protein n=2 Tax=Novosphingobium malaysiense TaxID=1348853 RepID=A0A0B1ZU52_9SPHN|nr:hypothetical protein LK12_05565 [Novosphingobium malaysiense]